MRTNPSRQSVRNHRVRLDNSRRSGKMRHEANHPLTNAWRIGLKRLEVRERRMEQLGGVISLTVIGGALYYLLFM